MNASLRGRLKTTSAQAKAGFWSDDILVEEDFLELIVWQLLVFEIVAENELEPNSRYSFAEETVDSQAVLN